MKKISNDHSNYVTVKYSDIHGNGIFALRPIPENESILIIEGEVISPEEAIRRENEENNVYIFWNGDVCIDTVNSDKIKYINHSCEPNCRVVGRSKKSLRLVSKRIIEINEELTIDYAYNEIYSLCRCNKCSS